VSSRVLLFGRWENKKDKGNNASIEMLTRSSPPPLRLLFLCIAAGYVSSCSEFAMRQSGYTLSARNEDFSGLDPWFIVSFPKGLVATTSINPAGFQPWSYTIQHGFVAFMENSSALEYLHGTVFVCEGGGGCHQAAAAGGSIHRL
jgi:hypothetical protein